MAQHIEMCLLSSMTALVLFRWLTVVSETLKQLQEFSEINDLGEQLLIKQCFTPYSINFALNQRR